MSFEHARTVTSSASPAAVWALWSNPGTWSDWDPAVEGVVLDGPFTEGTAGTMTLAGGVEAPVVLEVVDAGRRYLDRLALGDLVIRIDHVVEPADGGSEITVATTIEGPGAEDVGPMVTTDAPTAMARLVQLAEEG